MQKNDTLNSQPVDRNLGRAATSLFAAGGVEEAEFVAKLDAFLLGRGRVVLSPLSVDGEPEHRLHRRL